MNRTKLHRSLGSWLLVAMVAAGLLGVAVGEDDQGSEANTSTPVQEAALRGARFLVSAQQQDGSWLNPGEQHDLGITALAVYALSGLPEDALAEFAQNLERGVAFITAHQQEDGKFLEEPDRIPSLTNYKTSLSIMALVTVDSEAYQDRITRARDYLTRTQFCENFHNISEENWAYGGWDYNEKVNQPGPDLSNVQATLEALRAAGLSEQSEVWKRAVTFLERCQNSGETNDMVETLRRDEGLVILDDGGFYYEPLKSKAGEETLPTGEKGLRSYGSMTYAGLKSFLYAHVDREDPRVQAAYQWVREHYTLEENPQMGKQGWFYYFHTFAKALDAYGEPVLVSSDGVEHDWAQELVDQLLSLQNEDGSWSNDEPRWFEGFQPLTTSYVVISLNVCRSWVKE